MIIDHVSYSDHHGYYQCYAINELLGRTYEDSSVIYLNVKKNTIWIPIVIACVIIGIGILGFILCSKYYQRRRKKQMEEKEISQKDEKSIDTVKQIVSNRESIELTSSNDERISKESVIQQKNLSQSSFIFQKSLQFILSNPFLDPNAQLISSIDQHSTKLK